MFKSLYIAFVHPHLLYGIEVYGNSSLNHLNKLIILNKKLLRIVQNESLRTQLSGNSEICYADSIYKKLSYVRYGFLLVCYNNFVPKIFDFKNAVTLKPGLGICEGH